MREVNYNNFLSTRQTGVTLDVLEAITHAEALGYAEYCNYMRTKRNGLLAETDVWALSDRTMTAAQTQYRQDLRDITDQAGFPTDITWPTKPE